MHVEKSSVPWTCSPAPSGSAPPNPIPPSPSTGPPARAGRPNFGGEAGEDAAWTEGPFIEEGLGRPSPALPRLRRVRCSSLPLRGMPCARGNLPVPPLPFALRRLPHPPLATSRQYSFWCAASSGLPPPRRACAPRGGPRPALPGASPASPARCSSLPLRGMPCARGNLPVPPLPLALRRLPHPPLATSRQYSFWCAASSGHPPPQRLRCSQASHSGRGFWG